jgi:hypothetical protein
MARLWKAVQFWKKWTKPMYKEGEDYLFVDVDAHSGEQELKLTAVQLKLDNYLDVVYHYHQAKVVEEGELARLQFGYTILDSAGHDIDELNTNQDFHNIMGDILTQIITAKIEHEKTGTNNSKELNLQ